MAQDKVDVLSQSTDKAVRSVKSLKKEIADLKDGLLNVEKGSEDWQKIVEKLVKDQADLKEVTNATKQTMDAAADSIVGMERQYKALYDTYKLMSEEQRNSEFGKQMAAELEEVHNKLNETKMAVGNYKDNIGNYTNSVIKAFDSMKGSVLALQNPLQLIQSNTMALNGAFKTLAANPVGAALTAIVIVVKGFVSIFKRSKEAIEGNEESTMKLKTAMAAFQPIIDASKNAFDKLGQTIVKVVGFIGDAVNAIRKAYAAFTDFIGVTEGAKEAVTEQIKVYKELAIAQNEHIKNEREIKELNSADKIKIEQLREEAMETENVAEKTEKLKKAKELQAQVDERNIQLAKETLDLLERESALTANDAAANDKLTEAKVRLNEAMAQAATNAKRFEREIKSAGSSAASAAEAERKKADELIKSLKESSMSQRQLLTTRYNEQKKLLEKYNKDTTLLTRQYYKEIKDITLREEAALKALKAKNIQDSLALYSSPSTDYFKQAKKAIDDQIADLEQYMKKGVKIDRMTLSELLGIEISEEEFKSEEFLKEYAKAFQNAIDMKKKAKQEIESQEINWMGEKTLENLDLQIAAIQGSMGKLALDASKSSLGEMDEVLKQSTTLLSNITDNANLSISSIYGKVSKEIIEGSKTIGDAQAKMVEEAAQAQMDNLSQMLGYYEASMAAYNELINNKTEWDTLNVEQQRTIKETLAQMEQEHTQLLLQENQIRYEDERAKFELSAQMVQEKKDMYADAFKSFSGNITKFIGVFQNLAKEEIQEGKLSKEQIEKKKKTLETLQKVQTAVAIAQVVADTAGGVSKVWQNYAAELLLNAETAAATGPAAAATKAALDTKSLIMAGVQTGVLTAAGVTNIAAIVGNHISGMKSIGNMGGSSSGGGASATATPTLIDSSTYGYSSTRQNGEEEDTINRVGGSGMYVSVTDINNVQNRVMVTERESTF